MPSLYTPVAVDTRLKKTTGKYTTRAELVAACKEYAALGWIHKRIGEQTGVSKGTVERILKQNTAKATAEYREPARVETPPATVGDTPLAQLYKQWKPTELPTLAEDLSHLAEE